jgi:hypothetical protein
MLSDQRRETFAQNVATGHNLTESARRAGFGGKGQVYNTASRLAKEPAVAERINQLRALNNAHTDSSVASKNWVLCEAIENHKLARAAGDINTSRQCLELVARLQGYLVERREGQSVQWRLNPTDPKELSAAIKTQLELLPPSAREAMLAAAPKKLADAIEVNSEPLEPPQP